MKTLPGRRRCRGPKLDGKFVVGSGIAVADGGCICPYPDVTERGQRRVIERRATLKVGDAEGHVVQHGCKELGNDGRQAIVWNFHGRFKPEGLRQPV